MTGALADDLTGAAEIAGIALRYGLSAAVSTERATDGDVDLLVLDTETRPRTPPAAANEVRDVFRRRAGEHVEWLFKKIDSVLRGPVVAEIAAALSESRFTRAVLVPANPDGGRIIRDGRYIVGGCLIDQTEFARDPEFPVRSAHVLEMLGSSLELPMCIRAPGSALPEAGLIVGEAESGEHLAQWAATIDERTLAVGAAAFFDAVLRRRLGAVRASSARDASPRGTPALTVSGSASIAARQFADECERQGRVVLRIPIPPSDTAHADDVARWTRSAVLALEREGWALLTLANTRAAPDAARTAHAVLVRAASTAVERAAVRTLYVDGGATAAAVARLLGWSWFEVAAELTPGVVVLRPRAARPPIVIMKPGSYQWPPDLLN